MIQGGRTARSLLANELEACLFISRCASSGHLRPCAPEKSSNLCDHSRHLCPVARLDHLKDLKALSLYRRLRFCVDFVDEIEPLCSAVSLRLDLLAALAVKAKEEIWPSHDSVTLSEGGASQQLLSVKHSGQT